MHVELISDDYAFVPRQLSSGTSFLLSLSFYLSHV